VFSSDQISIRITPCTDQEACLCNVLNITSTVSSLVECSSAMVYDCSLLINVSDQHICISPGLVPRPRPCPSPSSCVYHLQYCTCMQQNAEWGTENEAIHVHENYDSCPLPPPIHHLPPPSPQHTQEMQCQIANPTNLETERPLTVTVHLGNQVQAVGTIRIREPLNLLVILIPVFAGVIVLSAAIFIVVVAVFCRKTRQKDQRYDQLILELERLESSVARECKLGRVMRRIPPVLCTCMVTHTRTHARTRVRAHAHTHTHTHTHTQPSPHILTGFAELQTDLDELTGDVAGCRLPYWDIQSYLVTSLFPGARDHPVMHGPQVRGQSSKSKVHCIYVCMYIWYICV